jgi:hypothetical protein
LSKLSYFADSDIIPHGPFPNALHTRHDILDSGERHAAKFGVQFLKTFPRLIKEQGLHRSDEIA